MSATGPDRSRSFSSASVPEQYARRLAPVIFEPWAELLLEWVSIESGDRVLDVASGTGVVARAAAGRAGAGGSVVASDISPAMLAEAAAHAPGEGAAPIEYVEASADRLPFEGGAFDVVVCQQGLQFFTDKPAAVASMRRVLAPGGRLGLAVWAAGHALPFDDFGAALAAIGAEPPFLGAFQPSTFSLTEDALAALLEGAGLASVEIAVGEMTALWPDAAAAAAAIMGTPFGPLVEGLSSERRAALHSELRARFGDGAPTGEVRRLMVALLARARA